MADETNAPESGWGIHIHVPQGTLTDEQAAKIQDTANKVMPHLVEAIGHAHNVNASGSSPRITRFPSNIDAAGKHQITRLPG